MSDEETMGQVFKIDEARIRDHLGKMVRGTVEETLNAMLDAEADQLCGAGRYERNQARQDTRAGSYERTLHTKASDVGLKIPKLRRQSFETAIIERYRRRECDHNSRRSRTLSRQRALHARLPRRSRCVGQGACAGDGRTGPNPAIPVGGGPDRERTGDVAR